jgi:hypothetical protein
MKIPPALPLLIVAALPLWLTACTDEQPSLRPRLLASGAARTADVSWIEPGETAPDQLGERVRVTIMSCAPSLGERPRLVIVESGCTSATVIESARRID